MNSRFEVHQVSGSHCLIHFPIGEGWDPVQLAESLSGTGRDYAWLDSSMTAYGMGEWSIIACTDSDTQQKVTEDANGRVWIHSGDQISEFHEGNLLDFVDRELASFEARDLRIKFPFIGGYIGYIGYGSSVGSVSRKSDEKGLNSALIYVNRFALIDHKNSNAAYLCVLTLSDEASVKRGKELIGFWHENLLYASSKSNSRPKFRSTPIATKCSVSAKQYLEHLGEIKRWLLNGDSYEACYTYNISLDFQEFSPFEAYLSLRQNNPAPYSTFLRIDGRHILSTSPEKFLSIQRNGHVESKPIKGTLRRTCSLEAVKEFETDVKTRAENLMIVDLIRNDLTKVCEPTSIEVPNLMAIETYETVHQMVSTISGHLKTRSLSKIMAAVFPGGSMTGAPKKRSIELLENLEPSPRGVYSGCLGYFSFCGQTDLSIVIRTAVVDQDRRVTIGTGGAITVLSDPLDEIEETIIKSSKLLEVFNANHPFREELDAKDNIS